MTLKLTLSYRDEILRGKDNMTRHITTILMCLLLPILPALYFMSYSHNGLLSWSFFTSFSLFNLYIALAYRLGFLDTSTRFSLYTKRHIMLSVTLVSFSSLFVLGIFSDDVNGVFWGNFGIILSYFIFKGMRIRR